MRLGYAVNENVFDIESVQPSAVVIVYETVYGPGPLKNILEGETADALAPFTFHMRLAMAELAETAESLNTMLSGTQLPDLEKFRLKVPRTR